MSDNARSIIRNNAYVILYSTTKLLVCKKKNDGLHILIILLHI